jgi:hypothetical protein
MSTTLSANVNVVGSKLKPKQERFLRFMQILDKEDKHCFMTLPSYEELFKEVLENEYYTKDEKEHLNRISDLMKMVIDQNPRFKEIYTSFMKQDVSTASEILTQLRLEEYIQNIGRR